MRCRQFVQPIQGIEAFEAKFHLPSLAILRQHGGAGSCLGGGRKRGQQRQALGRSSGGFSSKIHHKTDFDGLPIAFHLAGGEVSDTTQLEMSLDIRPGITPRVPITDKGYESAANRAACHKRGIIPRQLS